MTSPLRILVLEDATLARLLVLKIPEVEIVFSIHHCDSANPIELSPEMFTALKEPAQYKQVPALYKPKLRFGRR